MTTKSETILVADDDPTILSLLEKVLLSKGYVVLLAENGKVALEILEKHHVDLLMTDIKMEPIDGVQLLKIIGKKYPDLPAIALNIWVTVPLIDECIKLGVYDFIGLPFKIEEMIATVRHALAYGDGSLLSHAEDSMPEFVEAMENKLHQCKKILREKNYMG